MPSYSFLRRQEIQFVAFLPFYLRVPFSLLEGGERVDLVLPEFLVGLRRLMELRNSLRGVCGDKGLIIAIRVLGTESLMVLL